MENQATKIKPTEQTAETAKRCDKKFYLIEF